MKKIARKKIEAEVLEQWPECPKEFLVDAFAFNHKPTADQIIHVGHFAKEVGGTFHNSRYFLGLMDRIRRIEKLMISKYGSEAEDLLLELREDFMKLPQLATTWTENMSPGNSRWNWEEEVHLLEAMQRAEQLHDEMYPGMSRYIDDTNRSRAEYRESKKGG